MVLVAMSHRRGKKKKNKKERVLGRFFEIENGLIK